MSHTLLNIYKLRNGLIGIFSDFGNQIFEVFYKKVATKLYFKAQIPFFSYFSIHIGLVTVLIHFMLKNMFDLVILKAFYKAVRNSPPPTQDTFEGKEN